MKKNCKKYCISNITFLKDHNKILKIHTIFLLIKRKLDDIWLSYWERLHNL